MHHLHDPAWLGWDFDEVGFLPDGDRLWYLSEESGFSQIYLLDLGVGLDLGAPAADPAAAPAPRQLTSGEQVVSDVRASRDGSPSLLHRQPRASRRLRAVPRGGRERRGRAGDPRRRPQHLPALARREARCCSSTRRPQSRPRSTCRRTSRGPRRCASPRPSAPRSPPSTGRQPALRAGALHPRQPAHPLPRLFTGRRGAGRRGGWRDGEAPRPAVVFIHGAGYLQNAHAGWSELLPRVHVPHPADPPAATWCSTWTTAPPPATAATGARRSTARWATPELEDLRGRRRLAGREPRRRPARGSASTAAPTAASSPSWPCSASRTSSPPAPPCGR